MVWNVTEFSTTRRMRQEHWHIHRPGVWGTNTGMYTDQAYETRTLAYTPTRRVRQERWHIHRAGTGTMCCYRKAKEISKWYVLCNLVHRLDQGVLYFQNFILLHGVLVPAVSWRPSWKHGVLSAYSYENHKWWKSTVCWKKLGLEEKRVTGGWRKLRNEWLHDLSCPLDQIKKYKMRVAWSSHARQNNGTHNFNLKIGRKKYFKVAGSCERDNAHSDFRTDSEILYQLNNC
jgi:hypothetical protein